MIINILLLILSILCLWYGANYLVESASRVAVTLGISELVIGLTIVAFGTSAPEFAVTISAAINGYADISVGNIVGSNNFNLGFILGSVALIRHIQVSPKLVYRDGIFIISVSLLLFLFFYDYKLTRWEGAVFVLLLIGYLLFLFFKKESIEEGVSHEKAGYRDIIILPVSILTIIGGGLLLVHSATNIARIIGISNWIIGVTIVAAGTSAPEMATSLVAAIRGRHGISAGNLIGSDLFNILGVLGLAGIIHPLSIETDAFKSLILLIGMVVLVVVFMRSGWKLTRNEGIILILIGVMRWLFDILQ